MKNETAIENRIHQLITEERKTGLNPYLSTRVMAAIERRENHQSGPGDDRQSGVENCGVSK